MSACLGIVYKCEKNRFRLLLLFIGCRDVGARWRINFLISPRLAPLLFSPPFDKIPVGRSRVPVARRHLPASTLSKNRLGHIDSRHVSRHPPDALLQGILLPADHLYRVEIAFS